MSKSFTIRDLPKEERPRERIKAIDHTIVTTTGLSSFKDKGII